MLPIKDNNNHKQGLPLATIALVALSIVAIPLSSGPGTLVPILLDIFLIGLLSAGVEATLGHVRFCAVGLFGGLLAFAIYALTGGDSATALLFGILGATAAVLGSYLVLFPRGRVLTLVLIPFTVTIIEVPAVLLLGGWLLAQVYFGAAR